MGMFDDLRPEDWKTDNTDELHKILEKQAILQVTYRTIVIWQERRSFVWAVENLVAYAMFWLFLVLMLFDFNGRYLSACLISLAILIMVASQAMGATNGTTKEK